MALDQEKTPSTFDAHADKRRGLGKGCKVSYDSLESGSLDTSYVKWPRESPATKAAVLFLNLSGERLLSYFPFFFLFHNSSYPSISVSLVRLGINTCNEANWDRGSFICSGSRWPKQCFTPSAGASVSNGKDP